MRSGNRFVAAAVMILSSPATAQTPPEQPTAVDRAFDDAPAATPAQPAAKPNQGEPGYFVQVAALTDPARAAEVAKAVGGKVSVAAGLNRVRTGPYANEGAAQAARDAIAGRGYGDARIVRE